MGERVFLLRNGLLKTKRLMEKTGKLPAGGIVANSTFQKRVKKCMM
jgi:hypothetical protein